MSPLRTKPLRRLFTRWSNNRNDDSDESDTSSIASLPSNCRARTSSEASTPVFAVDSERFSDLTLAFSGETLRAHKVILYARSGWFKKALDSNFKEANADTIELHDDDPTCIKAMIEHCYSKKYADIQDDHRGDQGLLFEAELYMTADKYDVPSLKKEIRSAVVKVCSRESMTELHNLKLYPMLERVFELPRGATVDLRSTLACRLGASLCHMLKEDEFRELVHRQPDISLEFLDHFHG